MPRSFSVTEFLCLKLSRHFPNRNRNRRVAASHFNVNGNVNVTCERTFIYFPFASLDVTDALLGDNILLPYLVVDYPFRREDVQL